MTNRQSGRSTLAKDVGTYRECEKTQGSRKALHHMRKSVDADSFKRLEDHLWSSRATAPRLNYGEYRTTGRLSVTTHSTVYEAERNSGEQKVAIKTLSSNNDRDLERFRREAKVHARLKHPNIGVVHRSMDAVINEHTNTIEYYYVLELVQCHMDNPNGAHNHLTAYCDDRRLPIKARLELFADACRAVVYAHENETIHRDIKPANILVGEVEEVLVGHGTRKTTKEVVKNRPTVKLIDFGLAKDEDDRDPQITAHNEVVGTRGYMSPEQAAGKSDVTTKTDVYSLGVVLFELLTGRLPKDHEDSLRNALDRCDNLTNVAECRSSTKRMLQRQLDAKLARIVEHALKRDQNERIDAKELLTNIIRYLNNEPLTFGDVSILAYLSDWRRRNRVRSAVLAASVVFCVIAAPAFAWLYLDASRERARANDNFDRNFNILSQSVSRSVGQGNTFVKIENAEQIRNAIAHYEQLKVDTVTSDNVERSLLLAKAYEHLARYHFQSREFDDGLSVATKGTSLLKAIEPYSPKNDVYRRLSAMLNLRFMCGGEKDIDDAVGALQASRRALDLTPEAATAHYAVGRDCFNLGKLLFHENKKNEAEPILTEGILALTVSAESDMERELQLAFAALRSTTLRFLGQKSFPRDVERLEEAIDMWRLYDSKYPNDLDVLGNLLGVQQELAAVLVAKDMPDKAKRLNSDLITTAEQLYFAARRVDGLSNQFRKRLLIQYMNSIADKLEGAPGPNIARRHERYDQAARLARRLIEEYDRPPLLLPYKGQYLETMPTYLAMRASYDLYLIQSQNLAETGKSEKHWLAKAQRYLNRILKTHPNELISTRIQMAAAGLVPTLQGGLPGIFSQGVRALMGEKKVSPSD